MKRILSLIMTAVLLVCIFLSALSPTALSRSDEYYGADRSGAYHLSFSGRRADIILYPSQQSYYVELNYDIAEGTAGFGKAVLLSNDVSNDMLIVHIYEPMTGCLSNFAVNGLKAYENTVFCYDGDSLFITDNNDPSKLRRYSSGGTPTGVFSFDNRVSQVFCDHNGNVYAVSRDRLFRLDDGFTALSGDPVSSPLFPVSGSVVSAADGRIFDVSGTNAEYMFNADSSSGAVGGCIIGNLIYYPDSNTVYGYDRITGEKRCYYKLNSSVKMLYACGDSIMAIGSGNAVTIPCDRFTMIEIPGDDSDNGVENPTSAWNHPSEIRSDVYKVDHNAYQISLIPTDTTVAVFKRNMIYTGYEAHIYKGNAELKSGNVGTGCTVVFSDDNGSLTYELSVKGDLTGEGRMNSRDLNILMDSFIGAASFNGVYVLSADINNDSHVDVADMALMKRLI